MRWHISCNYLIKYLTKMLKNNKIINDDINHILETDLPWQNFKNKSILITGEMGSSHPI